MSTVDNSARQQSVLDRFPRENSIGPKPHDCGPAVMSIEDLSLCAARRRRCRWIGSARDCAWESVLACAAASNGIESC